MSDYYAYIMTNNSGTLYAGVTNSLERRVYEHKQGAGGFTKRYMLTRLVYYESTSDVRVAIEREKEIKGWVRRKKIALIASMNSVLEGPKRDVDRGWTRPFAALRVTH